VLHLPLGDLRDFPPPPGFHLRLAPQKELQLRPDIAPVALLVMKLPISLEDRIKAAAAAHAQSPHSTGGSTSCRAAC